MDRSLDDIKKSEWDCKNGQPTKDQLRQLRSKRRINEENETACCQEEPRLRVEECLDLECDLTSVKGCKVEKSTGAPRVR